MNLWLGRAGLMTYNHYDAQYNFFIQIQGRKRFYFAPPTEDMYEYPCLHPHFGHSQVNISDPNIRETFPHYYPSHGLVEVGPGDVLVVPPFWWHQVETVEDSISINVWTDTEEFMAVSKLYAMPVGDDIIINHRAFVIKCMSSYDFFLHLY